ncbi:MAG: cell division protein FtsL [Methanosarcinaceae archaeon]
MTRSSFLPWSFLFLVVFIFFKIYQHNKLVKVTYQKQRIDQECERLEKENNRLLVELYKLKDQNRVKRIAQEKLGMQEAKLGQIRVLS